MQRLPLIACWTLLLLGAFSAPLSAQETVQTSFDPESNTWLLANSLIRVQYRLDEEQKLRLWDLRRSTGQAWVEGGAPYSNPVHMELDHVVLGDETAWTLAATFEEAAGNGRRHVLQLIDDQSLALITLSLEIHPGQPFIRWAYTYRNLDSAPHTVLGLRHTSLRVLPAQRPVRAFYVNQVRQSTPLMFEHFERTLDYQPGGVSVQGGAYGDHCTWLAIRDGQDQGLILGWEFDGRAYLNASLDAESGNLELWGAPVSLNASVPPEGELAAPAAFVGLFGGDWDEAAYRTHRYVEAVLATPPPDGQFPYFVFNTWGYNQQIDETTLRRAAEIAAAVGVEMFVVDLGWARRIGDWEADPVKFPSGFAAFREYVRSLGMKFGLHFVPVEASAESPMLQENPDWTSSNTYGYFGAESICLSHAPVQNHMQQVIRQIVERYQPDQLTQDGENLVKVCTKETHTHDPANSNWSNSVEGLNALVEFSRSEFPNIIWENNGDGGTMSTFAAVRRYATFGSCDACEHMPRRQSVYGMSYVFPPRFIDRYMEEPPIQFTTRSSMFGGPWILMQRITEWTPQQIEFVKREAAIYKSLRGLIRDGKVFHLTERPDGFRIEAMESFHPEQNRGVVFVYRPDSPSNQTTIYPRGLRPDGRYQVTFQEGREFLNKTGAELMSQGIRVSLPTKNFAEIVYINGF